MLRALSGNSSGLAITSYLYSHDHLQLWNSRISKLVFHQAPLCFVHSIVSHSETEEEGSGKIIFAHADN